MGIIRKRGTFTLTQDNYEIVIRYEYYSNNGTYEQPPEEELEITDVWLNDMDITDFYWDYLDFYEEVVQYAREH
tara:strand:+ start:113 stop:334 length:222 start_codon:yes stop_codon:yes gene_type:complete